MVYVTKKLLPKKGKFIRLYAIIQVYAMETFI